MIKLVIATHNTHKLREFRTMLKHLPQFDILSLHAFADCKMPEEIGNSFEENAKLKAQHIAKATNCLTLADDSGLIVPALNGAPGIYSARYAGLHATDKDNRAKLLGEMSHLKDEEQRYAYFECCLALAFPNGKIKLAKGTCLGTVANEEKGSQGFGYDSLFIKEGYHHTFGEIDENTKSRISHRRKAIDSLLHILETLRPNEILC
ncbi:MAG: hamA [Chlamydiales bacterium]|jgi:XTP/dITP diphosphohydrolase|nr:hamA [Chlamydiales bacterium]